MINIRDLQGMVDRLHCVDEILSGIDDYMSYWKSPREPGYGSRWEIAQDGLRKVAYYAQALEDIEAIERYRKETKVEVK